MGGYDPKGREIIADFARVMHHLGTSFGVLRKEKCTGDPVRRLGNDLLFQQLSEANLETLAQNKVRKIVTICPHCVRTIQEDWKEYGTPPEVEHHSEFMARFADKLPHREESGLQVKGTGFSPYEETSKKTEGALAPHIPESGHDFSRADQAERYESGHDLIRADQSEGNESGHDFSRADKASNPVGAFAPAANTSKPEKIVFHDPCYLGRYRNVYDEPRAIVAQSGELVEAPRNHERSFCCGAGGGLAFLGEESGQRVSHNRAAELVATGATTIATACPFCNTMFRDALAATGDAPPQLVDIAQLVARGLPKTE
jgi:Fe-S oxidoreductase